MPHRSLWAEALDRLAAHAWPGNIRELRNVLERARLFADDGVLRAEQLPEPLDGGPRLPPLIEPAPRGVARPGKIDDVALTRLAEQAQGTRKALARQLGLSKRTLYRRLKALGRA